MNASYKRFGEIVGSVILNKALPQNEYDWEVLVPLFEKHNLIPVLKDIIDREKIVINNESLNKKINTKALELFSLQINQLHEINKIKLAFEDKQIDNLFFKGAVTTLRYPKPKLRTMSDVDLLYKSSQNKELKNVLSNEGYLDFTEGRKNDTFRKKNITLETHRQLVPSDSFFFDWCNHIWERSVLCDGMSYSYRMTQEDEIVFNVIHLAIHFLEGGAGARFLCDLLVYKQLDCDWQYIEIELNKLQLWDFYNNMINTAEYWFNSTDTDCDLYNRIIDYIMKGGIFGNIDNAKSLKVEDGRLKYLIHFFFPSYKEMCSQFSWLKGKAILLPWAWIVRGVNSITKKKKSVSKVISSTVNTDKSRANSIRELYNECGLNMRLRN